MAFPTTFYLLTRDGEKVTITGALMRTVTPRLVYRGKLHRFGLDAPQVGGGMGGQFAQINAAGTAIVEATSYYATVPTASTVLAKHDQYTLIDPRHTSEKLDFVEFWDAVTPGFAMTCSVTTASGSATVVVGDTRLYTVGQGISGTGIPTGARVAGVLVNASPATSTQLILTHQATGTATVEATLTGANYLGGMAIRDLKCEGAAISTLI